MKKWTKAQHDVTVKYVDKTCAPIKGLKEEITAYIDKDYISPTKLESNKLDWKLFYEQSTPVEMKDVESKINSMYQKTEQKYTVQENQLSKKLRHMNLNIDL